MKIAILFFGNLSTISLGGIDSYVKSIIDNAPMNWEITVYGISEPNEYEIGTPYKRIYHNRQYIFIAICDNNKKPLSLYYAINERKWISALKDYDCVFLQRVEFALPLYKKNVQNVVQIIHGSGKYYEYSYGKIRYLVYSIIERISVSITDKTFVIMNNDKYGVPYYKKLYPKSANKFYFAINPVELSTFHKRDKHKVRRELHLNNDSKILLYLGRIIDNPKRVMLIPEICTELNRRGINCLFLILGDGPDLSKLKTKVDTYNISEQFIFKGFVSDKELTASYISASDAMINISMYEGTCTSNIEACAAGIPVVSTDVGEVRELVHENYNGYIALGTDRTSIVSEIADGIEKVLNNEISMNSDYLMYESKNAVDKLFSDIMK